jgi:hypothetical protein
MTAANRYLGHVAGTDGENDRWCPLHSPGRRSSVYPVFANGSGPIPVADAHPHPSASAAQTD